MERHDDDNIVHVYQEENEGDQGLRFTVSDGAELTELATRDVKLMEDEPGPSKKHLQKSKWLTEKQEQHDQLNARVAEADSDADDFWEVQ
jgi:hypothetical protein